MDSFPTRASVKRQYFDFHKNSPNGINESSTAQDLSVNLEENARLYLGSVKFEKRFSALDFKHLLCDALSAFPTQNHLVIKDQILVGVKNLEKYGLNLWLYPWRKEFRILKITKPQTFLYTAIQLPPYGDKVFLLKRLKTLFEIASECCDLCSIGICLKSEHFRTLIISYQLISIIVLKLYSGFFIYNVESKFKPALKILKMFGYQEVNPQELSIVVDYRVEGGLQGLRSKIKELVFELFLMSVELRVLDSILQFADQEGYALEDALRSRRRTSGDVQEAVQWLERNATKSSALKRRKYDNVDDFESHLEDYTKEKDSKTEDLENVEEDEERVLLRHQRNREKFGTKTRFRNLKYPPRTKVDSGLATIYGEYHDSQSSNIQHYESVNDNSRDPLNSEVTSRYGDDVSQLVSGYSVVQDHLGEIDDSFLYGHGGDHPTAGEGLQADGVKKSHFPVVTTQEFSISNERYISSRFFLNKGRSSIQNPDHEPLSGRPTENEKEDTETFSSCTAQNIGDYVFIGDPLRQSVGKTMQPRQHPEQAIAIHSSRNLSSNLELGETQIQNRMGEMKKDLPHLVKESLNIQYQGSHSSPAAERSNTYPNEKEFGVYVTITDNGKLSRNTYHGLYSTSPEQKRPTYDKTKYQNSGPDLFPNFYDQLGSSTSATSAKQSTRVSVTTQHSQQSSRTVSGSNQSYESDRLERKYVSNVHTTSAISSPLSSVKSSNTAMPIKLPPIAREKMLLQKASEKSLPIKAKQSEFPSSPIIAASDCQQCEHCGAVGSSICRKCFMIRCERCREKINNDLCPKLQDGEKRGHLFVDLSSRTSSQSSDAYSEQFSANTTEIRSHGEEKEQWNCQRCTMLNPHSNTVCSTCATTRDMEEPSRPVTGSRNCPQCTYANPEGAKVCTMCHKTMDEFSTNV